MKTTIEILGILIIGCASASAQVAPVATGPGGIPVTGNLHYAFRYSQTAELGATMGDWQTSNASASFDYANVSKRLPFTMEYSGGYTWTISGPTYSTGQFQHLSLSQGIHWNKWVASFMDDVSYRPQIPTTSFSGIPGTGDPIGGPGTLPPPSQSILAVGTHVVYNSASGQLKHGLNYATMLTVGGGSDLLRYPDGVGLNTNSLMANAVLTHRLDARDSLSETYRFSQFSYTGYSFTFLTQAGLFGFKRQWTRKVTTDFAAGPQWTGSSDANVLPSSTGVAANATIDYLLRTGSASLTYSRQVIGGSGYLFGAQADDVSATFSREVGRDLSVGAEASYRRTSGLQNNGVIDGKTGGVEARRRLGRYLSAFANYTVMDQSSSSTISTGALNGLIHVIGFGIEYSPREKHIRH
jgi:hypothetical protein